MLDDVLCLTWPSSSSVIIWISRISGVVEGILWRLLGLYLYRITNMEFFTAKSLMVICRSNPPLEIQNLLKAETISGWGSDSMFVWYKWYWGYTYQWCISWWGVRWVCARRWGGDWEGGYRRPAGDSGGDRRRVCSNTSGSFVTQQGEGETFYFIWLGTTLLLKVYIILTF